MIDPDEHQNSGPTDHDQKAQAQPALINAALDHQSSQSVHHVGERITVDYHLQP